MEIDCAYRCNIDYEYELFNIKKKPKNINKELEYLLLLVEDKAILLQEKLSDNYLNHLKQVGFNNFSIVKKAGVIKNWWGKLENLSLEKKLNSKITSFEMGEELGLNHSSTVLIDNNKALKEHVLKYDYREWILKPPFLFSGKGFRRFTKEKTIDVHEKVVLEAYLKRTIDIGTLIEGSYISHYINYVDSNGAYKGTLCNSKNNVLSEIEKEQILQIKSRYEQSGATDTFSIDSFVYIEDNKEIFYPLVEVNYRKSLGYIAQKLRIKFEYEYGLFFLIPSKNLDYLHLTYDEVQLKIGEVKLLSPFGRYFTSFFIGGNSLVDIKNKISCKQLKHYLDNDLNLRERI